MFVSKYLDIYYYNPVHNHGHLKYVSKKKRFSTAFLSLRSFCYTS